MKGNICLTILISFDMFT